MDRETLTTHLLRGQVTNEMAEAVYDELRAIAAARLADDRQRHRLQPTALVHEAFIRMVGIKEIDWQSRTHFRAMAAIQMRRVIIDAARHGKRDKRSGRWQRVELHDAYGFREQEDLDVGSLHEAMEKMRAVDPRQARIVELRVFSGMTIAEIASVEGLSARTVDRDWKMGLAWLRRELAGDAADAGPESTG